MEDPLKSCKLLVFPGRPMVFGVHQFWETTVHTFYMPLRRQKLTLGCPRIQSNDLLGTALQVIINLALQPRRKGIRALQAANDWNKTLKHISLAEEYWASKFLLGSWVFSNNSHLRWMENVKNLMAHACPCFSMFCLVADVERHFGT